MRPPYNRLGSAGCVALTLGPHNVPLAWATQRVSLDLTANGIDHHGFVALTAAMHPTRVPYLRWLRLNLSHNILHDDNEECGAFLSLHAATNLQTLDVPIPPPPPPPRTKEGVVAWSPNISGNVVQNAITEGMGGLLLALPGLHTLRCTVSDARLRRLPVSLRFLEGLRTVEVDASRNLLGRGASHPGPVHTHTHRSRVPGSSWLWRSCRGW